MNKYRSIKKKVSIIETIDHLGNIEKGPSPAGFDLGPFTKKSTDLPDRDEGDKDLHPDCMFVMKPGCDILLL